MRIIIKYQVDNQKWSDEEFDNSTDRELIIEEHSFSDILRQKGLLETEETLHDITSVELKHR